MLFVSFKINLNSHHSYLLNDFSPIEMCIYMNHSKTGKGEYAL